MMWGYKFFSISWQFSFSKPKAFSTILFLQRWHLLKYVLAKLRGYPSSLKGMVI
jgi:hypothetical protein